ncbi:O-antigen ligase domain-containing protein [Afipia massiliensis]|uniref:O-antigen ligase domain-containing protein n=1 Tax=Afipia massiliensis TaxID=211460 RepID=A0A4U6BR28_9BRAD|nr:O-antigen ligase family protein [Afipia massiliensis]TKT72946.1 O-antigen ligase domain-containing protein [Afipia massiliensis]
MASLAATDYVLPATVTPPRIAAIQRALMWAVGVGGAIVFIEPSPYELVTLASVIFFFATGLRMRPVFIPLLILLFLLNMGYTICSIYLLDKKEVLNWILTSWYLAITALFFAMVLSEDTADRLESLRRGLILGALLASLAGIAGYFHLAGSGGYDLFTLYSRARGTFKDPNVLGAYLILPALFLLQTVVTQSFWKSFRSAIGLGIVSLAVLLAFSRASWGQLVACSGFMLMLMYMTTPSQAQRTRIVTVAIAAAICAALLLVLLLSFDSVSGLFKERASFNQTYDSGRFGRFGRHALGFQMALELPLGIGPLQFSNYFPEDTHNSFLNAFMSGGWIAGVCFPALVFITVIMGFKLIFVRVPWQRTYLAIFSAFFGTVCEAFVIDIDHWRHFWMMLGIMWAMFAAAHAYTYRARTPDAP